MTTPILVTKLYIPPFRPEHLPRLNLIAKLNGGLNRVLTIISAPAGYGKTTLLSEWVSKIDIPVAWLSLEKGENVTARFWNYFITALHTIPHIHQAGIGESILQVLQSSPPASMDTLLDSLVNDFTKLEEGIVLVLDDLHTITESQIHQDLVYLIDHLPLSTCRLHLVVAGRMDPPWPLARWRVRGELNELRTADLRFTYDETFQFFEKSTALKLSSQDVAAVQDRTEGWIAGLQMAAVSMQGWWKSEGTQGVAHFIESFTGSHRFILDYLMEEVVSQQPQEIQDFLHKTSILERLTAPLCDALTDRQDSQAMLKAVERGNLFLIPLDDERQWYRYHHLFSELLYRRLKQTQPNRVTELHQRASNWYVENNLLSEAISHALDAGDVVRVNEIVSGNGLAMAENTELIDVLRHFEEIPAQEVYSKPWLGVAYTWAKAYADPSAEMDRIIHRAEQGLTGVVNASERQHLASHLNAIRAYVAWVKGKADLALKFAHDALENLPENDWIARSHVINLEGLALQYKGDLAAAVRSFEAAIAAVPTHGRIYEAFQPYSNLAFVNLLGGRLRQAYSLCQHILRSAHESGQASKSMPVLAYAYATMSMVQLEWNEVEAAIASAREGVALAKLWNQADTLHFTLTCLSKALYAAGGVEEALAANLRAMQLAANVSSWFFQISALDEIGFNLAKGDISAAAHRFKQLEPQVEESDKRGLFRVTKVALLNAQGNYSDVLEILEEVVCELEQRGSYWTLMNLIPFQALALQALGRTDEALAVIDHCLVLASPEGYVRIFVERGAPMLKLLKEALNRGIQTEYIRRLLPAFSLRDGSRTSRAPTSTQTQSLFERGVLIEPLIEPLSEREIEVLQFLQTHLTIPEIAREMSIAPSTLRTHVRNIYLKLDVHGRIEAIQKAKELTLI